MRTSDQVDKLFAAIVKAQGELKNPPKDKTANTGKFSYSYSDLATVLDMSKATLAKNGLGVISMTVLKDTVYSLHTRIIHASGQWIEGEFPVPGGNSQEAGKACSYGRRYNFCGGFNIMGETDTDAAGDGAKPSTKAADKPAEKPAAPIARPCVVVEVKQGEGAVHFVRLKNDKGEVDATITNKGVLKAAQEALLNKHSCTAKLQRAGDRVMLLGLIPEEEPANV